ncbi:MmoB/DmpM family protein [Diaphorobacter ruginosibacter]|jgi:phenol hydroxylase P2 protein|uniref:MmoB/DmpM family protein n=1 Tax=Diaphorobacter ruginosibacter TaxID=1715720 RepID=A0A7G9RUT6_9BURK|nr:MmoB/DmpM family protein [Diaphorobacter ruginosibacter]MDR2332723.1 MmoB/DmpM family protein [Burkholderiaceae bacterium]QNN59361.1 MmoB/DmpM family protein [Diaphorobacter ruginosibacter]
MQADHTGTEATRSKVFIAFQDNEESRAVIEAVLADNTEATAAYAPGLVKIDCPGRLVIRRESIEEITGQPYNLQQIQINLVTLSGHVNEDDDEFSLSWGR